MMLEINQHYYVQIYQARINSPVKEKSKKNYQKFNRKKINLINLNQKVIIKY